jgi:probable O-glycosylation ligase (exosortase A-associated)
MRDIAFIGAFLAMLVPALRFGHVGVMLWVWVALVAPTSYLYGIGVGLPFNKIVVAVAVLSLFLDKNKPKFYADTHVRLLIAFLTICMISYMFALSDKARVDVLADRLSKEVILCLFVIWSTRSRLQIHSVLIAVTMGLAIHGSIEGSKYIVSGGGHILSGPRTIGDNNNFGLAMLMVIPLLMYLYRYSLNVFVRGALVLAIATNLVAVVASNSRGALVGLMAIALAMFMRSRRKVTLVIVFVLAAGTVAALAPERWSGRMSTISNAEADGSFISRVNSWKINTLIALSRPLIGGGFSAGEDYAVFQSYLPGLPTFDFIPTPPPTIAFAAHSIYFEVLGDNGFLGLFLFLGLLFVGFRNGRIVKRLSRGRDDLTWAADLTDTFRLSLVAYAVAGAALSMAYFELYYLVLTLLSVMRRHIEESVIEKAPDGLAILQRAMAPARLPVGASLGRPSGATSVRPG